MFDTLYESNFGYSNIDLYFLLGLILIISSSSFILKKIYIRIFGTENQSKFWFIVLLILAFLGAEAISLSQAITQSEDIKSGRFLSVEGEIQDFMLYEGRAESESFTVDGVIFKYSKYRTPKHYFANRHSELIPLKNGDTVRVFFIKSGSENFIFKLQVEKDLRYSDDS